MNAAIKDFIGVFDGAFEEQFCKDAIETFEKCDSEGFTIDRTSQVGDKALMDDKMLFNTQIPLEHVRGDIYRYFKMKFWEAHAQYESVYQAALKSATDSYSMYAAKIQRTQPSQGYHVWHYENASRETSNRLMAFILYLNDVEEGGETEFLYYSRRVKPKTGRLLLFPAGYTHLHRGNPPLSGSKYILTGWLEL